MSVAVSLPDSLQTALEEGEGPVDLQRWALEAMVLEALREGRITRRTAGRTLGLGFHEGEAFFASRGITYDLSEEDWEADKRARERMFGR